MWCANEKENMWRTQGFWRLLQEMQHRQEIVWKLWSCHKSTAPLYCTLDSECGLFRSLLAGGQSDTVAASIFAMLAAYSGSCVPETALSCWTLNSLSCPFNMDIYVVAPLGCGVARHNWLCEWAILLFWEGLEYKSFVLKNENRDGVLFLFRYQATRVENGTIPMVSTCSRRVVYGQVKDWFLRSSY